MMLWNTSETLALYYNTLWYGWDDEAAVIDSDTLGGVYKLMYQWGFGRLSILLLLSRMIW